MLGDFMQHQAEQPRSQFDSHILKVHYAYWDSEVDRWTDGDGGGKDGEATVALNF